MVHNAHDRILIMSDFQIISSWRTCFCVRQVLMFCNGENKKLAPAAWESQHGVSVEEAEEDHDKLLR